MKKMNILISGLGIKVGGGEILAMQLANELAKQHHVTFYYHWDNENDKKLQERIFTNEVTIRSMNDFPLLNFFSWKINALLQLFGGFSFHDYVNRLVYKYILKKQRIQVVSSHSRVSDTVCVPCKQKNIPVVITEHGEYVMAIASQEKDYNELLSGADKVVCVSDFNKRTILQKYPALSSKIQTIYNGTVLKRKQRDKEPVLKKLGIASDCFVFGMVSRGIPEKGWEELIRAFLILQENIEEKIALVLVGGGPYMDELAEKYKAHQNIVFTGFAPDPSLFIQCFHVGVLPTRFKTEAFGLAILEYIICGVPAIATDVGGVKEVMKNGDKEFGQLIPFGDCEEIIGNLVIAMKKYITDKNLYQQHIDQERLTEKRFSIEACAQAYTHLFNELVK